MSDDRHYIGGEWYRICDRTGFKIRDTRTRKEWTGMIVREGSWESRQPQDLVQGVADDQNVSDPRPRQLDTFIGPLTTVTSVAVAIGAIIIPLQTSLSMLIGDTVWIMMDNGIVMKTIITSIPDATTIQISPPMVGKASAGNQVTDVSAQTIPVL